MELKYINKNTMSPSLMNLYLEGKRNTEKITISQSDDAYHENKER